MFQHPAWVIANIGFWVGLHPLLRVIVYPRWDLKAFMDGMEIVSATLLILQILSLWTLHPAAWPAGKWKQSWRALGLMPMIWLLNSLVLWLLVEFQIIQDPLIEPLYDSQLFIRRHPFSWTAASFLLSAVLEEMFFRGWLPDYLQRRWRKSLAIGMSAALFALAHLGLHTNAQALLAYFLFALSLSYVRSFHGLGAAVGVHLLNNILAFSSQVYAFNLFAQLSSHTIMQYSGLGLLALGVFLIGRDFLQMVDRGKNSPY